MFVEHLEDGVCEGGRHNVLSPDLEDARSDGMGESQEPAEVEIVGEDQMLMMLRPSQDVLIRCSGITDLGPVDGLKAAGLENPHPVR